MNTVLVIVAAGASIRFRVPAKPFVELLGQPMIAWSLDAAQRCPAIDEMVLVTASDHMHHATKLLECEKWPKLTHLAPGGATRQESVAAGLTAVAGEYATAVIHDAARPLVETDHFTAVIEATTATNAAIVATPVVDTLKRVEGEFVSSTISRDGLWSAQTPQSFPFDWLRQAIASPEWISGALTDEAMLCELLGFPVVIVPGSPHNLKITYPADLALASTLLAARAAAREAPP